MKKVMLAGKQVTFRTKISNSKKQLAKIISENGGWPAAAGFAVQDKKRGTVPFAVVFYTKQPQRPRKGSNAHVANPDGVAITAFSAGVLLPNWHQTILSRDEYFHLYPAQDADGWIEWKGGECPVAEGTPISIRHRDGEEFPAAFALGDWNVRWTHDGKNGDVVAYRLRKQEHPNGIETTSPFTPAPTIEQLAADYKAKLAIAQQAQEEADSHRCGAEAALEKMVAAGKALGLVLSIAAPESELVITDWRDLQVGDVIWCCGEDELAAGEYIVLEVEEPSYDGVRTVLVNGSSDGQHWIDSSEEWRFIRRHAKGGVNA